MLIPAMEKGGYPRGFSAAVTAASSCIGPIIPPSIIMVIYGSFMGVSIAGLFAAGIIPGLLMGLALMAYSHRVSTKRNYPKEQRRATIREILVSIKPAFLSLMMPAIILGGILGGIFTPTEAAAVALFYALLLGVFVYRNIKLRDIWDLLCRATSASAIAFTILSTATIFSWLLTVEQVPQNLASLVLSLTTNKYVVLMLINIFCLVVGCVMDITPAVIVLSPILWPLADKVGVHSLHFAMIMCLNLTIGLATPPVGACLFTCCSVGRVALEDISKEIFPFLLALLAVLMLVTYVPAVSLTIPRLLGFAY
jgi:tripartite ATP-independent transporter DctM subunit